MTPSDLTIPPRGPLLDAPAIAAAADEAIRLARSGQSRRAIALALHARSQAAGLDTPEGALAALNASAIIHSIRGDFMAAVATGIDTHDLARRQGNASVMEHARVTLSAAAFELGSLADARRALEACVSRAVKAGEPAIEIRARVALGIALGDLGLFDEAAREFARALFMVRFHKDSSSPARVMTNLANLHCKRARRHQAQGEGAAAVRESFEAGRLAQRALAAAVQESNVAVQIDATAIHGRALALQGERNQAIAALQSAANLGRQARARFSLAWILCEIGRLHREAGDFEASRAAYGEALDAAVEMRPSRKIEQACAGLAETEQAAGQLDQARAWRERAVAESADFERVRHQTRLQLDAFFTRGA